MSISVVICTISRLKEVILCLEGLKHQQAINFEVIVVDGRKDNLLAQPVSHFKKFFPIKRIRISEGNLPKARNIGIHHSKSKLVAFIDDDAIPFPSWTKEIEKHFLKSSETIILGGRIFSKEKDLFSQYSEGFFRAAEKSKKVDIVPGVNFIVHLGRLKRLILKKRERRSSIFDETYVRAADDTEFCLFVKKLDGVCFFDPSPQVFHHYRQSVIAFMKRQMDYAWGDFMVTLKYPEFYFLYPYIGLGMYFKNNHLLFSKKITLLLCFQPLMIMTKVLECCSRQGLQVFLPSLLREISYTIGIWNAVLKKRHLLKSI